MGNVCRRIAEDAPATVLEFSEDRRLGRVPDASLSPGHRAHSAGERVEREDRVVQDHRLGFAEHEANR
jgi:hypothetical protein